MRCPWCAHPETIPVNGILMEEKDYLINSACPFGAITSSGLDREQCSECTVHTCIHEKWNKGVKWSCFEQDTDEILKEVLECRAIFFDNGGVTFTGGEPTVQFEALKEVLYRLRQENIHTVIESNGISERLDEIFPYLDLLIIDFKHIENDIHTLVTKESNEQVKINIGKALESGMNVLIRTLLIHGFNDNEKYIQEFIEFYKQYDCSNAEFEFLKYHEFGKAKWEQCGFKYEMKDGFVTDKIREKYEQEFRKSGMQVVRT